METAILLLIYNRELETKKLLRVLKKIKPKKIYIGADGPKNNEDDLRKCLRTRLTLRQINWRVLVKKNFSKKNLGCRKSITKSLNWFFKNEKKGIILEDDCIPNKDFFKFSELMLNKYKNNKKIFCISGSNHSKIENSNSTYYFSKYPHCWGWATWRRAWKKNKPSIKFWPRFKRNFKWLKLHPYNLERRYWNKIFDNVYKNNFDSWAYPWTLSVWYHEGLTIIPNKNLINNIGYGLSSTNSIFRKKEIYKNQKLKKKIKHPRIRIADIENDTFVFKNHYKGINYLWPFRAIYIINLLIRNPFVFFKKILRIINFLK
jgi:hypothetical protein